MAEVKTKFEYEALVIDPILNAIKKHQDCLVKQENLPQLAKLGYMYNTLWYIGRFAWGFNGKIQEGGHCEDNPKYKIEMCEPKTEEAEDLIYDAWGMHVENEVNKETFEEFSEIIKNGRSYSDFEKKLRKKNKTFDEWVEVLTNENYKYSSLYPNRISVADHLLCVIGNGYDVNEDGYIVNSSGGNEFGEWENAEFEIQEIQDMVDRIISYPEVKETFDVLQSFLKKEEKKKIKKSREDNKELIEIIKESLSKDETTDEQRSFLEEMLDKYEGGSDKTVRRRIKEEREYSSYYPICKYSLIYKHNDPERKVTLEPSAVDECVNICKDILHNKDKEDESNVEFAKKFLANNGYDEYKEEVPKEIDKYALEKQFLENFEPVRKWFPKSESKNIHQMSKEGSVSDFYLNNTRDNEYADNNYYGYVYLSVEDVESLPKGLSNSIDVLKGTEYYEAFKKGFEDTLAIEGIDTGFFYFRNIPGDAGIDFKFIVSNKQDIHLYNKDVIESEENFVKESFSIGNNSMSLYLDKVGVNLLTQKAIPLGSTHPNNKSGEEYFSNAQYFEAYDKDWNKIANYEIDERNFNTFRGSKKTNVCKWLHKEHAAMKASDKAYGKGDSEGEKCLYAHDFMLWLRDRQDNYNKK